MLLNEVRCCSPLTESLRLCPVLWCQPISVSESISFAIEVLVNTPKSGRPVIELQLALPTYSSQLQCAEYPLSTNCNSGLPVYSVDTKFSYLVSIVLTFHRLIAIEGKQFAFVNQ